MKKYLIIINFLLITLLISCAATKDISINIINIKTSENTTYKLVNKEFYTIEDLPKYNNPDFNGYKLDKNGEFIKADEKFKLENGSFIYIDFGFDESYFDIKNMGYVAIKCNEPITSKETYQSATITIVREEDEFFLEKKVQIRLRGNSTLWVPKKAYKFKFSKKEDIFGMGEEKDWVLLANYFDPTHLRNYYAYKLAKAIGLEYSVDCEFVQVYFNNQYHGLYLLTEQVETGKERVNIENGYDKNKVEVPFLLEFDQKLIADDPNYQDNIDNEMFIYDNQKYNGKVYPIGTKYPDSFKDITLSQYTYIKNYIKKTFESVREGNFSQYIDINSFIDFYLIQELFMNIDLDYSSVYCYKPVGERLKFGPIWDFDLSSGNVGYAYNYTPTLPMSHINGGNYLFETALNNTAFRKLVDYRIIELNKEIIPTMLSSIHKNAEILAKIAERDDTVWNVLNDNNWARPNNLVGISYMDQVNYFYNFINTHNEYMQDIFYK